MGSPTRSRTSRAAAVRITPAQDVNAEMLAERPAAELHRAEGAADHRATGRALRSTRRCRRRCRRRPADIVAGKSVAATPPAEPTQAVGWRRQRRAADRHGGVVTEELPLRPADGRRRAASAGGAPQGLSSCPALLLITVFLVVPALWTLYLGLTDYRLTGLQAAQPAVRRPRQLHARAERPGVPQRARPTLLFVLGSAVIGQNVLGFVARLDAAVDARLGPRRSSRRSCCSPGSCPSSVVALLWIAFLDRRRRHAQHAAAARRDTTGCSTTRWPRSSSSTPGAARRSR